MRDFTLAMYRKLCIEIKSSSYTPVTVEQYSREIKDFEAETIILRHDVDRKIEAAMNMARLEHSMDIRATYYFRKVDGVFCPPIIKEIESMGHEVGYHYEVLDKTNGNKERAIELFEKELNEFRKFTRISTVCMHGNPLTRWSNKELWQEYDFRDFGIICEPYLSINYNEVFYFSDTGRTWNNDLNVKDTVAHNFDKKIYSTDQILKLINEQKFRQLCILVHPNRWTDNMGEWFTELVLQNVKNFGKFIIKLT